MKYMRRSIPVLGICSAFALAGFSLPQAKKPQPASPIDGATVFKARCASCHGEKGQGGGGYAKPLVGSLSAKELANFIGKSMPPGPKKCPAPDAEAVAQYMFDAFYSPLAQERIRPPRVALARLTVKQYRNCLADLIGNYHPAKMGGASGGLQATYYKARNFDQKTKVVDRIDPVIKFDFGNAGPVPDQYDPYNFSILWQGSIEAPDSGEYEFVVQSDNAVRLFVNGPQPIIDAFVRSGNEKEFHAAIKLIGGRTYPFRLEFSKATQGVEDPKRQKEKPPGHANVTLLWRRPKESLEVVPSRYLHKEYSPTSYVIGTPFPPDDRSMGYERGSAVSKEWEDSTTAAAVETANYVATHLQELARTQDTDKDYREKLSSFCRQFAGRAFRKPLTAEEEQLYVRKQFDSSPNVETAVKRSVILTLLSPRFLYREVGTGKRDGYRTAADLSFALWDSIPDQQLLDAAASGQLDTPEKVAQQATRMSDDPRAWSKLRDFLLTWLKVDDVPEVVKSQKLYPEFSVSTVTDLRTSLELYLESTAGSDASDYREMMTSGRVFLNSDLGSIYGYSIPQGAGFQPVEMDNGQRVGLITQPYLLARFGYLETSSPIHRGVLIVRNLLGKTLNPPPSAFAPDPPSLHPNLTTRERVTLQTKPEMCNNCHGLINPIGFTLENFDAIGKYRVRENGKSIDHSGYYRTKSGNLVKFAGPADLAKYIAESPEAQSAFIEKLFLHEVKQPMLAYGSGTLPKLEQSFGQSRYSIRKLMADIATLTATKDMQ